MTMKKRRAKEAGGAEGEGTDGSGRVRTRSRRAWTRAEGERGGDRDKVSRC